MTGSNFRTCGAAASRPRGACAPGEMSRGSPRQPRGGKALGSAAAAVLLRAVCVLLLHASPAVSVAVSSEQELRQAVLRGDSVVQIETPLLRVSGTGRLLPGIHPLRPRCSIAQAVTGSLTA